MTRICQQKYTQSSSITENVGSVSGSHYTSTTKYIDCAGKPMYYVSGGASACGAHRNSENWSGYAYVTMSAILSDDTEKAISTVSCYSGHNWKSNSGTFYLSNYMTAEEISRIVKIKAVIYANGIYTGGGPTDDWGASASCTAVAWYGSWDNE